MVDKKRLSTNIKRIVSVALAINTAVVFSACDIPVNNVSPDEKDIMNHQAKLEVQPKEETPEIEIEKEESDRPLTSGNMEFVVPSGFEKIENFSYDDFVAKNPEVIYSDEELLKASEAYFEYLDKFSEDGWNVRFSFACLNNDNLSEMINIVYSGELKDTINFNICTYDLEKEEVVEIGNFLSDYGTSLYYIERCNFFWYAEWRSEYQSFINYYLTVNDENEFELVASFEESYDDKLEDKPYYVNNVETDYNTYNNIICQYYVYSDKQFDIYAGKGFLELKNDYDYSCFIDDFEKTYTDDLIDLAMEEYSSFLSTQDENVHYEFAYMDYDNLPELLISEGDSKTDGVTIYRAYVYENNGQYESNIYEAGSAGSNGKISYSINTGVYRGYEAGMGLECDYFKVLHGFVSEDLPVFLAETRMDGTDEIVYKINGALVSEERFKEYLDKWTVFEFVDVSYSDMHSEKDKKSVEKNFKKLLGK